MSQLLLPTPGAPDTAWSTLPPWWHQLPTTRPTTARRPAGTTSCPTCHEPLLVGLDNDICAAPARTDPTPLTPLGEALAHLAGRPTYRLRRNGRHLELDHRTHLEITHQPADHPHHDVLPAHACGTPPLPTTPTVHAQLDTTTWKDLPNEAPF